MSSVAPGFAGVRFGYIEAEHALRIATPRQPLVAVGEIAAFDYLLMAADARTRAIITGKLAGVDAKTRASIVETVEAYVEEDLSMGRTAARLGVHENTVRYRLERIGEVTGHNPRHLRGVLELLCILRLEEFEPGVAAARAV